MYPRQHNPIQTGYNPYNSNLERRTIRKLYRESCQNEFLTFFCFFIDAKECLINCYCEEYRVECTLFSCRDETNTEYDEVVIHGTLCQSRRYTLTHIIQDTLIILKDDICEEIPNCQ